MKLLRGLSNIGLAIVIGIFAFTAFEHYFITNKKKVDKYELLTQKGKVAYADINNEIEEVKVKIKRIRTKVKWMTYNFNVSGNSYTGKYYLDKDAVVPTDSIKIRFLPEDPSINDANVAAELLKARKQLNSNNDLWMGLGATLLSLFLLVIGVNRIIKGVK
ncbi:MAG: hypothetical protein ACPGLV_11195 [Bacteroidia bacterium]